MKLDSTFNTLRVLFSDSASASFCKTTKQNHIEVLNFLDMYEIGFDIVMIVNIM